MPVSTQKHKRKAVQKAGQGIKQTDDRALQNGDDQASGVSTASAGLGFHLLAGELQTRTLFELEMSSGPFLNASPLMSIVDTEEKQLQAIEDLYAIVIAQPKYKAAARKKWPRNTQPYQVLHWLLKKLGALAQGDQWTIDTWEDNGKTRYRFVVYKGFSGWEFKHGQHFIPMDFLPYLKDRDAPLHDLIINTVALVSKSNGVPLWDEDGQYSEALFETLSDNFLAEVMFKDRCKTYINGAAAFYLAAIRKARKSITCKKLESQLGRYKADSDRKRSITWWVRKGIRVAEFRESIFKNTFIPNYEPEMVFSPYHHYKIVWSIHEKDPINKLAKTKIKTLKAAGDFDARRYGVTYPGQKYQGIGRDYIAVLINQFMHDGQRLFSSTFRDYFYNRLIRELEPGASTTLLETFVLNDLLDG